jgi:hypothetical protein
VLSTSIYPGYDAQFRAFVRASKPLLVDSRRAGDGARVVPDYYLLAAVPSPAGHWLLYAPDHADQVAHGEPAVTFDEPPLPPIVEYVALAPDGAGERARSYVWPASAAALLSGVPWTRRGEIGPAAYEAPQLRRLAGALAVNGQVDAPYSYLLRVNGRHLRAGAYFYAQGDLQDGGLTVGLQSGEQWVGSVNVVRRGRFAVMIAAPRDGVYDVVLANCVTMSWWQRVWRRGRVSNAFRIETAGWAGPV